MTKAIYQPVSIQELVNSASQFGLTPFLQPGKNVIMTFKCPNCGSTKMIKFIKQPDHRNKIHACKDCGYRHMSDGWIKHHGTFITGTVPNGNHPK